MKKCVTLVIYYHIVCVNNCSKCKEAVLLYEQFSFYRNILFFLNLVFKTVEQSCFSFQAVAKRHYRKKYHMCR